MVFIGKILAGEWFKFMRIIGGELKGKNIYFLKSSITRPLKDSVKESIFNIIIHSNILNINLRNSKVLDLYSGIGSFGLECISRGAEKITFIEKDKKASDILIKNLINLKLENKANVLVDKILTSLKYITEKFELIFLDTPFADSSYLQELQLIKQKKIYKKNHVVIIHREKGTKDNFETILKPLIIKKYGRSKIIFGKFL